MNRKERKKRAEQKVEQYKEKFTKYRRDIESTQGLKSEQMVKFANRLIISHPQEKEIISRAFREWNTSRSL